MKLFISLKRFSFGVFAFSLSIVFASGCGAAGAKLALEESSPPISTPIDVAVEQEPLPAAENPQYVTATPPSATASDDHDTVIAASDLPNEASEANLEEEILEGAQLSLMGVTVGSSKEEVFEILGEPVNEFLIEDEQDSITVFEYEAFSIGFTRDDQLEFVDILSVDIDPGLDGIRLGDTSDDVIQALGEPDTNTKYVVAYKNQNAVLKFDIDPRTKKIQSIKLFTLR